MMPGLGYVPSVKYVVDKFSVFAEVYQRGEWKVEVKAKEGVRIGRVYRLAKENLDEGYSFEWGEGRTGFTVTKISGAPEEVNWLNAMSKIFEYR